MECLFKRNLWHKDFGWKNSADKVEDYKDDFKGASIIEVNSLDEAVEIAKKSPIVKYGGTVEVLEEFKNK